METIRDSSQRLDQFVNALSSSEKRSIAEGHALVKGDGHRYTGQILIPAPISMVWDVLTDYSQLAHFLPSVESSRVIETEGDRTVVEQVAVLRILMATLRSRICTENIETPQTKIDFRLIEGDLKMLKGCWNLYEVMIPDHLARSLAASTAPHVLLKQTVRAEAGTSLLDGAFGMIFMNSMNENLTSIRQESMQRSPAFIR